jgi:hypothetical protein
VRKSLLTPLLLLPAVGLVSFAVADAPRGDAPAVGHPTATARAINPGNVHGLGEDRSKALQVGDIVAQMEKQPDGSCKSNGPVGVSGSDEPGEGSRVVLETDAGCTVRVKEITTAL